MVPLVNVMYLKFMSNMKTYTETIIVMVTEIFIVITHMLNVKLVLINTMFLIFVIIL